MSNAERERAIQLLEYYGEKLGCKAEFDLAIKALEKDKCSSCKHYDKDYGETCLNPEGTCRVFEYGGYEEADNLCDDCKLADNCTASLKGLTGCKTTKCFRKMWAEKEEEK